MFRSKLLQPLSGANSKSRKHYVTSQEMSSSFIFVQSVLTAFCAERTINAQRLKTLQYTMTSNLNMDRDANHLNIKCYPFKHTKGKHFRGSGHASRNSPL